MPAQQKEVISKGLVSFKDVDVKAIIGTVQSLTVKVNEPGKFKMSATLTCSDGKSAKACSAALVKALAEIKTKVNEEPKQPFPEMVQKYVAGVRTAVNAIQLSTAGAKTTAAMEVEPEIAVAAIAGWGVATVVNSAPAPKVEDSKTDPVKKAPNK
jgi:hypothetical protein